MMARADKPMTPREILSRTSAARQLAAAEVDAHTTLSIWHNPGRDVDYVSPKGHTFSYYLSGGHGSIRKGAPEISGGPGKICIIPEGADSRWGHSRPLTFLHVHVNDEELRRRFIETTGMDARLCHVPEIDYGEIGPLQNRFRALLQTWREEDRLAIEGAMTDLLAEIHAICSSRKHFRLKGGLSPHVARRIREFIEENLDRPLTLRELARLADLSEFHFQKMFSVSFGTSPARWIFHRRIARAREMLAQEKGIADIAAQCGFSDQSHLTRSFKKAMGMTPGAYRKSITGKSGLSGRFARSVFPELESIHVDQDAGHDDQGPGKLKSIQRFRK